MLKAFKTEISPTDEQKTKINKTIGTCRFIYNFYLAHNKELHESGQEFMSGKAFSVWLNNECLPAHPEKAWIKEVSPKSVKKATEDADRAFRNFFEGRARFPRFKKKHKSDVKMYFVRNSPTDCLCERYRLKVPTLGWVRLKEKGYIPTGIPIRSGSVSMKAGRYYVPVLVDMPETGARGRPRGQPLGIDLGLKEFAVLSDGTVYPNINKTDRVRKLERRLRREQRRLSRRQKGKNFRRQVLVVQRLYQRLDRIRTDYLNKTVNGIVKAKPSHVAIEDLNVSGMMKNRHLSRAIASQGFYTFRERLIRKCREYGIEVRIADRFFAPSKTCHSCGHVKKELKLSERTFICPICGLMIDRDLNAALNLRGTIKYRLAWE